jgi:hypothetical protein
LNITPSAGRTDAPMRARKTLRSHIASHRDTVPDKEQLRILVQSSPAAIECKRRLSLPKMPSGANGFEISDMKKMKVRPSQIGDENVTMLHWVENR